MSVSSHPRITFSERLPNAVVVHFEGGVSALFSAEFLYAHRELGLNQATASGDRASDEIAAAFEPGGPPKTGG